MILRVQRLRTPGGAALRGLAWLVSATAWAIGVAVAAMIALIFAASLVVIGAMASIFFIAAAAGLRARRSMKTPTDPEIIEARHVGGHSWVVYGWDEPR